MLLFLLFGISKCLFYTYNLILNYVRIIIMKMQWEAKRKTKVVLQRWTRTKIWGGHFSNGQKDNIQLKNNKNKF